MIRKIAAAMIFTAFTTFAAGAEDPGDIAREVRARDISMPVNDTGSIVVKACSSCPEEEFETLPNTSYEIGEFQVRREALRHELLGRPGQVLLVQLTPDRKHVARIKISAAPQ